MVTFSNRIVDAGAGWLNPEKVGKLTNFLLPLDKAFDPSKHPRVPKGSDAGGQFTSGPGGIKVVEEVGRPVPTRGPVVVHERVGGTNQDVYFAYNDGVMLRDKVGVGRRFRSADSAITALQLHLKKAAPKTLYVKRRLLNGEDIRAWACSQGFASTLPAADMHVTVAFSREPVDWSRLTPDLRGLAVLAGDRSVHRFPPRSTPNGALVLKFASDELQKRWQEFRDAGASWDFPEYQPHVTLTYSVADMERYGIVPYAGPLSFGPEEFAEVNEGWADEIVEDALFPGGG